MFKNLIGLILISIIVLSSCSTEEPTGSVSEDSLTLSPKESLKSVSIKEKRYTEYLPAYVSSAEQAQRLIVGKKWKFFHMGVKPKDGIVTWDNEIGDYILESDSMYQRIKKFEFLAYPDNTLDWNLGRGCESSKFKIVLMMSKTTFFHTCMSTNGNSTKHYYIEGVNDSLLLLTDETMPTSYLYLMKAPKK